MIGVFDSGVGGLSVVKEIFKHFPRYQIIYFGDTARLPYGTKGADFVKEYSYKITKWLLKNEAKIIIIACHTSSSWAGDYLRKESKDVPIFDMISPALKEVVFKTKNKRIGIIGTPGTIKSKSWEKHLLKLDKELSIYSLSCPLFVPLVEEGWTNKKITNDIVKEYLKYFKDKNIDVLVLACTHYPILEQIIKKNIKAKIINPAESLVRELKRFLDNNPKFKIKDKGRNKFFFSDEPYNLDKISKLCLNKEIKAKILDPFK